MFNRVLAYLFVFSFFAFQSEAQPFGFLRNTEIIVEEAGIQLKNPWIGGLNAPQFSPIDINHDGKTDLFVFERTGNKVYVLLNEGAANEIKFRYAPEYEKHFPDLRFWALLRDFDMDGKPDIFSSAGNGIKIHKNITVNGAMPQFELIESLLSSNYNPFNLNLFVSPVDLPAIDDIDGDGDLDILTFYILGTCVEYHRNLSIENSGNANSLIYRLETLHWGNFTENILTNDVNLNDSCGSSGIVDETSRHSGSTLTTFESNNDGLKNLLIGGIGYPVINYLQNGGTPQSAHMISTTFDYPPDHPVNLESFPASFIIDVNNDGKRDLIVAPNTDMESENKKGVHLYLNNGQDLTPDFQFQQNDFLQNEMLDFGQGAFPVFFDFDGDGDLDLVVGNAGYFNAGVLRGQIAVYRNIGTNALPRYRLVDDDLAQLSSLQLRFLTPTFGDLDGDGKEDMLIGTLQGNIIHYRNISTTGDAVFQLQSNNYMNINSGTYASPQLFDLDADGLPDLIIGNRSGRLSYFKNIGSSSNAQFSSTPDNNFLGSVRTVKVTESNFGYVKPCFFRMGNSTYLFCGSESGYIYAYDNIDNNLNGDFNLIDSTLVNIRQGKLTGVAAYDLNNDGKPEMIIGNAAGGLAFYNGESPSSMYEPLKMEVKVYPNPAKELIYWECSEAENQIQLNLMDMSGRKLLSMQYKQNQGVLKFPENLKQGVYFLQFMNSSGLFVTKKIIILGD